VMLGDESECVIMRQTIEYMLSVLVAPDEQVVKVWLYWVAFERAAQVHIADIEDVTRSCIVLFYIPNSIFPCDLIPLFDASQGNVWVAHVIE
jgi:hypothetical protein